MLVRMVITKEEAVLLLRKWHESGILLQVKYRPHGGHVRSDLLGHVAAVEPIVSIIHKGGSAEGCISFDTDVARQWEYWDMSDISELVERSNTPELLTGRPILAAGFSGQGLLILCDATTGVLP
jgi:hypothetical protein